MLNNFNFNHLYYFYIIASEGSLAAATKKLNVSQPTLSHQLKQFEDALGQVLFDRSGRNLKLNAFGDYILDHAKDIFAISEEMLSGLKYKKAIDLEANFTVGLTPSVCRVYAALLLKPLFADESIGIKTIENSTEELIEKLHKHEIDFVLSETPNDYLLNKGIELLEIKKAKYLVVCGKKFRNKEAQFPKDFNGANYFKYSASNKLQKQVDKLFYENDIHPKVVGESDDLGIMVSATEENHCFSIVPDITATHLIEDDRLVKLGSFDSREVSICALFNAEVDTTEVRAAIKKIKNQVC